MKMPAHEESRSSANVLFRRVSVTSRQGPQDCEYSYLAIRRLADGSSDGLLRVSRHLALGPSRGPTRYTATKAIADPVDLIDTRTTNSFGIVAEAAGTSSMVSSRSSNRNASLSLEEAKSTFSSERPRLSRWS